MHYERFHRQTVKLPSSIYPLLQFFSIFYPSGCLCFHTNGIFDGFLNPRHLNFGAIGSLANVEKVLCKLQLSVFFSILRVSGCESLTA